MWWVNGLLPRVLPVLEQDLIVPLTYLIGLVILNHSMCIIDRFLMMCHQRGRWAFIIPRFAVGKLLCSLQTALEDFWQIYPPWIHLDHWLLTEALWEGGKILNLKAEKLPLAFGYWKGCIRSIYGAKKSWGLPKQTWGVLQQDASSNWLALQIYKSYDRCIHATPLGDYSYLYCTSC